MEALSVPSLGVILIWASDDFLAAASSTCACEVSLPLSPSLSPPPEHAESTITPPSRADAAMRPLRRLPSVITRFSIVAASPNPAVPPGMAWRSRQPFQRYDRLFQIGRAHVELQSRENLVCRLLL